MLHVPRRYLRVPVALAAISGWLACASSPESSAQDGDLTLFGGGVFTRHTRSYESLADHPAVPLQDQAIALGYYLTGSDSEARWPGRAAVLALACARSSGEDREWLQRAAELATWQAIHFQQDMQSAPDSSTQLPDMPKCLGPEEVRDLLEMSRSFARSEADAAALFQEDKQ